MSQTVTAVSPAPITSPTSSASGPADDDAREPIAASSRISTSVIPICSGRSFQNGRPSSIS